MSDALDQLLQQVKDLKYDAHRSTDSRTIHGLINDLIDEIEIEMSNGGYDDDDEEDGDEIDFNE
tara:strand:- start:15356 stop:15547 length:192 start_codon:yes stop_codon:yes gene_type:complete